MNLAELFMSSSCQSSSRKRGTWPLMPSCSHSHSCLCHMVMLQGHFESWLELGSASLEAPGAQSRDTTQPSLGQMGP